MSEIFNGTNNLTTNKDVIRKGMISSKICNVSVFLICTRPTDFNFTIVDNHNVQQLKSGPLYKVITCTTIVHAKEFHPISIKIRGMSGYLSSR